MGDKKKGLNPSKNRESRTITNKLDKHLGAFGADKSKRFKEAEKLYNGISNSEAYQREKEWQDKINKSEQNKEDKWDLPESSKEDKWDLPESNKEDKWDLPESNKEDKWDLPESSKEDKWDLSESSKEDKWDLPEKEVYSFYEKIKSSGILFKTEKDKKGNLVAKEGLPTVFKGSNVLRSLGNNKPDLKTGPIIAIGTIEDVMESISSLQQENLQISNEFGLGGVQEIGNKYKTYLDVSMGEFQDLSETNNNVLLDPKGMLIGKLVDAISMGAGVGIDHLRANQLGINKMEKVDERLENVIPDLLSMGHDAKGLWNGQKKDKTKTPKKKNQKTKQQYYCIINTMISEESLSLGKELDRSLIEVDDLHFQSGAKPYFSLSDPLVVIDKAKKQLEAYL